MTSFATLLILSISYLSVVVGQYQKLWTDDRKQITSGRLVGVDEKSRPDIYEALSTGNWLRCDRLTKKIPSHRINDNYCDCQDGLDEPSTSACSHSQAVFWCHNNGISSLSIPTSKVNDGICDCCDGSDEYLDHTTVCKDTCNDERMATQEKLLDMKLGLKKRVVLEQDIEDELERLELEAEDDIKELKVMEGTIMQLKLHEVSLLTMERRRRRWELFDQWAGHDPKVCSETDQDTSDLDTACWPSKRPIEVRLGSQSTWLDRAHGVKVSEGPMTGLTLGMWLQRQTNDGRKKKSQRFATSAQYKEKTTLLSWLINSRNPKRRALTIVLLTTGLALSPITLPIKHFTYILTPNATTVEAVEDEVEVEDGEWYNAWRSVSILRKVYMFSRQVQRDLSWHMRVVLDAWSIVLALYEPTSSTPFQKHLLHYSDAVVLVQRGIRLIEDEVVKARTSYDQNKEERLSFADRKLWFPFRHKCYHWKDEANTHSFKFCPFKENFMDGASIGRFDRLEETTQTMEFHRGSRGGGCTRSRSSKVKLVCASTYGLTSGSTHQCEHKLIFGSPLVCTAQDVQRVEEALSKL